MFSFFCQRQIPHPFPSFDEFRYASVIQFDPTTQKVVFHVPMTAFPSTQARQVRMDRLKGEFEQWFAPDPSGQKITVQQKHDGSLELSLTNEAFDLLQYRYLHYLGSVRQQKEYAFLLPVIEKIPFASGLDRLRLALIARKATQGETLTNLDPVFQLGAALYPFLKRNAPLRKQGIEQWAEFANAVADYVEEPSVKTETRLLLAADQIPNPYTKKAIKDLMKSVLLLVFAVTLMTAVHATPFVLIPYLLLAASLIYLSIAAYKTHKAQQVRNLAHSGQHLAKATHGDVEIEMDEFPDGPDDKLMQASQQPALAQRKPMFFTLAVSRPLPQHTEQLRTGTSREMQALV